MRRWPVNRDDGRVEDRKDENEHYQKIIRRAKRVRERAAETLNAPARESSGISLKGQKRGEGFGGRIDYVAPPRARSRASH
jgi:hypothetical protein